MATVNGASTQNQESRSVDELSGSAREDVEAIRNSWQGISQWEPGQKEYGEPAFGQEPALDDKPKLDKPDELPEEARASALQEGRTLESGEVTHAENFDRIEPCPPPTESVEECGKDLHDAGVNYDGMDEPN